MKIYSDEVPNTQQLEQNQKQLLNAAQKNSVLTSINIAVGILNVVLLVVVLLKVF